ncbi:hypothetical protein HC031_08755 [Planosporangium thailandense]|uniref:Secreted protein n=1 Tax=Planosporangium thailandense TaxID=765197 RepID=A0ABX0XUV6_9ACTN|nr:hypothetical protein [Planosporangium thailandense]NJC69809.1 hypothetical protein [Planosporangium thailandense]
MSLSGPLGVLRRLRRGAARLRGLVLIAMLAAIAVTATTVWLAGRGAGTAARDTTSGSVVRVGVADGASIPDYAQRSRAELAALVAGGHTGETVALVTFGAYLAPDQLPPVLAGVALSQVYARVPASNLQTQIVRLDAFRVPADVTAGMDRIAAKKNAEAADYARLVAGLGTTDSERDLRAVYTSGQHIATVEAAAYRAHCACVYAAVVRAAPAALDQLAHRDGVRVVDPAPEVQQLDRAVFLPPLPEQRELAVPPDNSGQPAASPSG